MARTASTWRKYTALIQTLSGGSEPLTPVARPTLEEERLLEDFRDAVKRDDPAALSLLSRLDVSPKNYLSHMHYLHKWNEARRRLLIEGGNFQLLEGAGKFEDELNKVSFIGCPTRTSQQSAIDRIRYGVPTEKDTSSGWLVPIEVEKRRIPKLYRKDQIVWIYDPNELAAPHDLHPAVARSLVAEYMKRPGQVVDPMAGSGTLVQEARLQGHTVWASDKFPRDKQTREFDLWENDLMEELDGEMDLNVGLLVLHPPVPETIGDTLTKLKCTYDAWLLQVLKHSWDVLADKGHLALIVTISTTADTLSQAEFALLQSYKEAFRYEDRPSRPTATRMAVSKDGRQGWHILVMQVDMLTYTGYE